MKKIIGAMSLSVIFALSAKAIPVADTTTSLQIAVEQALDQGMQQFTKKIRRSFFI